MLVAAINTRYVNLVMLVAAINTRYVNLVMLVAKTSVSIRFK